MQYASKIDPIFKTTQQARIPSTSLALIILAEPCYFASLSNCKQVPHVRVMQTPANPLFHEHFPACPATPCWSSVRCFNLAWLHHPCSMTSVAAAGLSPHTSSTSLTVIWQFRQIAPIDEESRGNEHANPFSVKAQSPSFSASTLCMTDMCPMWSHPSDVNPTNAHTTASGKPATCYRQLHQQLI